MHACFTSNHLFLVIPDKEKANAVTLDVILGLVLGIGIPLLLLLLLVVLACLCWYRSRKTDTGEWVTWHNNATHDLHTVSCTQHAALTETEFRLEVLTPPSRHTWCFSLAVVVNTQVVSPFFIHTTIVLWHVVSIAHQTCLLVCIEQLF